MPLLEPALPRPQMKTNRKAKPSIAKTALLPSKQLVPSVFFEIALHEGVHFLVSRLRRDRDFPWLCPSRVFVPWRQRVGFHSSRLAVRSKLSASRSFPRRDVGNIQILVAPGIIRLRSFRRASVRWAAHAARLSPEVLQVLAHDFRSIRPGATSTAGRRALDVIGAQRVVTPCWARRL